MISAWSRRDILRGAIGGLATQEAFAKNPTQEASGGPRLVRGLNAHHLLNWPEQVLNGEEFNYLWPPFQQQKYSTRASNTCR
ncbi:hypothetical protein V5F85_23605, partial [Xanthobacter autotrophicus ATCC 700551]